MEKLEGMVLQQGQSYALRCRLEKPHSFAGRSVVFIVKSDLHNAEAPALILKRSSLGQIQLEDEDERAGAIASLVIQSNDLDDLIFPNVNGRTTQLIRAQYALWSIDETVNPAWRDVVDTGLITIKREFPI